MFEELGEKFEAKLLSVASRYVHGYSNTELENESVSAEVELIDGSTMVLPYITSKSYSVLIGISEDEVERWRLGYEKDPYWNKVIASFGKNDDPSNPYYPQYLYYDNGLVVRIRIL